MFLNNRVDVLVLLLNQPQVCLRFLDIRLHPRVVVKLIQVFTNRQPKVGQLDLVVLLLLPNRLLPRYPQQILLPPDYQLLPRQLQLVDVELVPLKVLRENVKKLGLPRGHLLEFLQVVLPRKSLVDPRHGQRFGCGRVYLLGQVVLREHPRGQEHLLVDRKVADQVVGLLVGTHPVVHLRNAEPLALAQPVAVPGLEFAVGVVPNEVLADVAQRNHILQPPLQLHLHHLPLPDLQQLLLRVPHLLLEVNVLHLLTVELLQQPALQNHALRIQNLQLYVHVYLPPLPQLAHTRHKRISNPALQQLQETNCAPHVDVFN